MNRRLIGIGAAVVLLLAVSCGRSGQASPDAQAAAADRSSGAGTAAAGTAAAGAQPVRFQSRSNEGVVMFQATPMGVKDGRFEVDLRVTTHSGDLSELDLKASVRLKIGDRSLAPAEQVALRGHHAGGVLRFDVSEVSAPFSLVFSDVRDMDPVVMQWR